MLPILTPSDQLALAYGTFLRLGWTPQWAGDARLVGDSRQSWKKPVDLLIAEAGDEDIVFKPHNVSGDAMVGRAARKMNEAFQQGYVETKAAATEAQMQEWQAALTELREHTGRVVAEDREEQRRLAEVMPTDGKGPLLTYGIIGINVLVFIAMAVTGVGIFEPSGEGLLRWGANYAPYTLGGQYWRLLTNCFVHIGIIHLAVNMYALLQAGVYLEAMLGRLRYACAYLACGLAGSLASLWWHDQPVLSAGASGAIFGMFGLFLALLTSSLLPKKSRSALLQSIVIFIAFNLLYGLKGGIDNSAHIGGLLSGLVIGYAFLPGLRADRRQALAMPLLVLVLSVAGCLLYLGAHADDRLAFIRMEEALSAAEARGLAPYKKDLPAADLLEEVKKAESSWVEVQQLVARSATMKLPAAETRRRGLLRQYADLRLQQNRLEQRQLSGDANAVAELQALDEKILAVLNALK